MNLLLAELIETYRTNIETFTGVNVTLGMPDDSEPGLYFFPYNFLIDPHMRNAPTRRVESQTSPSFFVKCLLTCSPSFDYVTLNKGFNYLSTSPGFEFNNGKTRAVLESISTEELSSIFISAGSRYRLSIPFTMKYSE